MSRSILAIATVLLVLPPITASASFEPVTSPAGSGERIWDLGASNQGRIAALVGSSGNLTLRLSDDGGATWASVAGWTGTTPYASVAADGADLLVASAGAIGSSGVLDRLVPGSATPVETALSGAPAGARLAAAVPLPGGYVRLGYVTPQGSGQLLLTIADTDAGGVLSNVTQVGSVGRGSSSLAGLLMTVTADGTTWVGPSQWTTNVNHSSHGSWYRVPPAGAAEFDLNGPLVAQLGALELHATDLVYNGAAGGQEHQATPVAFDPSLTLFDHHLVRAWSDLLYRAVFPAAPLTASQAFRIADAIYVADPDRWHPLGQYPTQFGISRVPAAELDWVPHDLPTPRSTGQPIVAQVNAYRAAAGFPPVAEDGLIDLAAENHSRYWTLNPLPSNVLDLHGETEGNPGFTGISASYRCKAVGTHCGGEVIGGPDIWAASLFHREAPFGVPSAVVGAATADGGLSVLNTGPEALSVVARPSGMPIGTWPGLLVFGEAPDPSGLCQQFGQPVSAPYGTTVTAVMPGPTQVITLHGPDGAPLRGCYDPNLSSFVPDDELQPNTTYQATATWSFGGVPQPDFTWTFTTGDGEGTAIGTGGGGASSQTGRFAIRQLQIRPARFRATRTRRDRHGGATIRVRVSRRARVQLRVAARSGRTYKPRRGTLKCGVGRVVRCHFNGWVARGRLKPGRYRLTARATVRGLPSASRRASFAIRR